MEYCTRKQPLDISLTSGFLDTLHETLHGNLVSVKKYRPRSTQTIYQYADDPIIPRDVGYGTQTKSSILSNLARSKSFGNISSKDSWVQNKRRLCKIRYYYRDRKPEKAEPRFTKLTPNEATHGFLTGSKYSVSYQLLEKSLLDKHRNTSKQTKDNAIDTQLPLEINGQSIARQTRGVNTKQHFLSLNRWHGADWQHKLPQMYLPRKEKYNSYASEPIRTKAVPTRFRDASEMIPIGQTKN